MKIPVATYDAQSGVVIFVIALLLSSGSETLIRVVNSAAAALRLLLVYFPGYFFEIIRTASTAAELPPFNVRAAKKYL